MTSSHSRDKMLETFDEDQKSGRKSTYRISITQVDSIIYVNIDHFTN